MNKQMTGRERLTAVFNHQLPDRPPWVPLIDPYFTQSLPAQGYPPFSPLETMKYLGCELFPRHVHVYKSRVENCRSETLTRDKEELQRWITPVGTIESRYKDTGTTRYCAEHWLKTVEDFAVMQYICEHTEYSENYTNWLEWDALVGEDGITPSNLNATGLYKFIEDAGVENFTYLLADYPDEVEAALEAHHEANKRLCAVAAKSPAQLFIIHENTSTRLMSPKWYRKYAAPHFDEVADIMHASGKMVFGHMCGHLQGLLKELAMQRLDGYESICPPTSGNLWAHDALQALPAKIVMGGLEPAALERMTVSETLSYTTTVLEQCAPYQDRFVLATGDATACGTPLANLLAISELVRNWRY